MSGQMWWSRDECRKAHPDASILLAYIRQQSLGRSRLDIHQHIAHCEECQKHCNEFQQQSIILDGTLQHWQWNLRSLLKEDAVWDWLQSPAEAQCAYRRRQQERLQEDLALGTVLLTHLLLVLRALLAQAVTASLSYVRKLTPTPQRRGNRGMGIISLSGGFAVAFLILVLTAIVVFAAMTRHYTLNPFQSFSSITTTVPQSTVIVPAHPTSTSAVVSQSGVTLTPAGPISSIFECSDKKTHRFGICGKNFNPNTKVELVVQFGDGSSRTRNPVPVDASGNFQDFWSIPSCKDVPITVLAQNITHPSVYLGVLQNIQYGKCSSNPLQRQV